MEYGLKVPSHRLLEDVTVRRASLSINKTRELLFRGSNLNQNSIQTFAMLEEDIVPLKLLEVTCPR